MLALLGTALASCRSDGTSPPTTMEASQVTPTTKQHHAKNQSVRCGHLHRDGSMWFGSNDAGVYRYDGESFTNLRERDGMLSDRVDAITHDAAGNLWFGTDRGLCKYDGESFVAVPIPWDGNADLWGPGMNANLVLSLLCDRRGHIWFGTWGNGAHRFDPTKELSPGHYEFDSFLQHEGSTYGAGEHRNVVMSIVEDAAGGIWLTSMSHGGVQRFDGERFTSWSLDDGLSDDMVLSACVARSGDLWFGTLGNRRGGLDRFDGRSFAHFDESSGLSSNNIFAIHEDQDGVLWLASQRGVLCRLRHGATGTGEPSIEPFTVDGATFEDVLFVTEDATGAVWFGGGHRRLYRYSDGRLTDLSERL